MGEESKNIRIMIEKQFSHWITWNIRFLPNTWKRVLKGPSHLLGISMHFILWDMLLSQSLISI